jgi:hypothetical protein
MPIVTVSIAPEGWPLINGLGDLTGHNSQAGHMWLTMPDGKDYGYVGAPMLSTSDSKTYAPGYYTHEIELKWKERTPIFLLTCPISIH